MEDYAGGYSIMRPLVSDFRDDVRAQSIGDQFLFGLDSGDPVTEPGATQRHIYLPTRLGLISGLAYWCVGQIA